MCGCPKTTEFRISERKMEALKPRCEPATETRSGGNTLEVKKVRTVLRFTVTGIVCGLVMGCLLSLGSGNYYVILAVTLLVTLVGVILGIVHRNDP
jgi:hypothetical protein